MEVSNLVPFGYISKSLNHHIFCKNLAVSAQKSLGLPQLTQNYQREWFHQFKGRKKASKERKETGENKGKGENKGGGGEERKGGRRKN